eukprot:TRINITY_DN17188_c0_g1_i1.p1 TRINITY_DN17188_c0_g1~~TRINITY_DN17188_c0_g1_i1.p1  ORF type:complete len:171 (+),score=26.19 TRINITY_DN17188_c0_g1_i1:63-515(+)
MGSAQGQAAFRAHAHSSATCVGGSGGRERGQACARRADCALHLRLQRSDHRLQGSTFAMLSIHSATFFACSPQRMQRSEYAALNFCRCTRSIETVTRHARGAWGTPAHAAFCAQGDAVLLRLKEGSDVQALAPRMYAGAHGTGESGRRHH